MKKFWLLLFFLTIVALSTRAAEAGSNMITKIEVTGATVLTSDQIIAGAKIISQVGEEVVKEKVENDVKSIYSLGWFKEVTSQILDYKGGKKIIFKVRENPKVKSIEIDGNTVFSDKVIQTKIKTKIGAILNFAKLQEDLQAIEEDLYHKNGYQAAKVVDVSQNEAGVLKIKIIEGVVEKLVLQGNETTKDFVILREIRTRENQPLNSEILKKDLQRIFNMGYFKSVAPELTAGTDPDKIIVVIKVEEQKTSSLNFGGGYGQREGWFAFTDLNIDNFAGTGQSFLLRGQFGQNTSSYQFRYFQPWFFKDHTSFTFRRWYTIGKDIFVTNQNETRNGWDAALSKPLTDELRATLTYKSENVLPETNPAYYVSSVTGGLSYDTRDIIMNPTQGELITSSLEQAGWIFGGTLNYRKYNLDLNKFFKIFEGQVLAAHLGGNVGTGDIRPEEKFWLGGPYTVRGYNDVKTGVKRVLFNLEYRITITDIFQLVFFFDAGRIYDYSPEYLVITRAGKGLGFRITTPVGPIRLDYGVGDNQNWMGGVWHFSIGQTF